MAMGCWWSYFTGLLELEMSPGARSYLLRHSPDGLRLSKDQLLGISRKHGLYCANRVQLCNVENAFLWNLCWVLLVLVLLFFLREVIFTGCEIHHFMCDLVAFSTSPWHSHHLYVVSQCFHHPQRKPHVDHRVPSYTPCPEDDHCAFCLHGF